MAGAKAKSVPAPASPLYVAPMGPEIRPAGTQARLELPGGSAWQPEKVQDGTLWHGVTVAAPQPVTWKHWGRTEWEPHCVLVCIFGIEWEPTLWEGWKVQEV